MKKWIWPLLLILAIAALFYLLIRNKKQNQSTLAGYDSAFRIEDPGAVTRIFMTNKSGRRLLLEKQGDNTWLLNDSLPAWQKQVNLLLNETMAILSVKGVVHQNARDHVIARLASLGTKVEIYRNDERKPFKEYYVGGTTQDLMGTYFWMEGAADPMIVDIPGHSGFVNSRYELNADYWISRTVFSASAKDIRVVQVEYPGRPEHSFRITQRGDSLDLSGAAAPNRSANAGAIRSYLNLFEKLNFEGFTDFPGDKSDSIRAQIPIAVIILEKVNGMADTLTILPKGSYEGMKGLYDKEGNMLAYDPDRYYALWSELDSRLLTIQDYTFHKVLLSFPDFFNRI